MFSCTHITNPFHIKEQKQVDHSDDTYHGSEEETKPTKDSQTHAWYLRGYNSSSAHSNVKCAKLVCTYYSMILR